MSMYLHILDHHPFAYIAYSHLILYFLNSLCTFFSIILIFFDTLKTFQRFLLTFSPDNDVDEDVVVILWCCCVVLFVSNLYFSLEYSLFFSKIINIFVCSFASVYMENKLNILKLLFINGIIKCRVEN